MKKPTLDLFERQRRIAAYRANERFRRQGHRQTVKAQRYIAPGDVLIAPKRFDITQGSGREVAKFLRALSATVLSNFTPVKINFRLTESFSPAATLLLFAEIDRVVALSELSKPVTIIDPRSRRPREVLKQIGLYELTGDTCDIVPERQDVVYWRATKGSDQSGDRLKVLEAVAKRVNAQQTNHVELSGIWRGVTEAVANSVEHAYKRARPDGFAGLADTKWWMFTQLRDGTFTVAVCDLGCGYRATINETIPEQFIATVASALLGGNRDAIAIDTAMQYGRSGTKLSERGKGSRDAVSVLQTHGAGELVIMSNTGWMRYNFASGREQRREQGDLGIDLKGTIIWWKLPLKEK